jgi:hypothetical protein
MAFGHEESIEMLFAVRLLPVSVLRVVGIELPVFKWFLALRANKVLCVPIPVQCVDRTLVILNNIMATRTRLELAHIARLTQRFVIAVKEV